MGSEIDHAVHLGSWSWLLAVAPALLTTACLPLTGGLPESPGARGSVTPDQALIERQPICVGSSIQSAGRQGEVLYYRAVATDDGLVAVGYFAFFSEERPWGNNWLTWSLVPALAVDMVYSRAFWVAPGLQKALHGAGDIEGVAVFYARGQDGSLVVDHAVVDDGDHHTRELSRGDVLMFDPARPTFYSDVWSHQLGGRGARSRGDLVDLKCYVGDRIMPLPEDMARRFRVDEDRAPPAHVERLAGRRVDVPRVPRAVARADGWLAR
jgi:hypothetical protein